MKHNVVKEIIKNEIEETDNLEKKAWEIFHTESAIEEDRFRAMLVINHCISRRTNALNLSDNLQKLYLQTQQQRMSRLA